MHTGGMHTSILPLALTPEVRWLLPEDECVWKCSAQAALRAVDGSVLQNPFPLLI